MRWIVTSIAAVGCGPIASIIDDDGDGWAAELDCDDADSAVHPASAEVCNAIDDDCDGLVDAGAVDATVWFADVDLDGAGDPAAFTIACDPPAGTVSDPTDCDDGDEDASPSAVETCNGRDDDCNGYVDDGALALTPRYVDADGDGHGDPDAQTVACLAPANAVTSSDDCDDGAVDIHPGASETCDGFDQDCDAVADEDAVDATAWHSDFDVDGHGWVALEVVACAAPAGFLADATDCDDFNAANFPGAAERCDGVDNNCDTLVDGVDAIDQGTWFRDLDGDGFGSTSTVTACAAPAGYLLVTGDCNDASDAISPLADEVCGNTVDDDCNGLTDESCVPAPPTVYALDELTSGTYTGAIGDMMDHVASAGDLDGDGADELVLAGWFADDGANVDAGLVAIAYGGAAPTGDTDVYTLPRLTGAQYADRLGQGHAASGVGDLDGDGLDELMIGAPEADLGGSTYAGAAYLLYGSATRETGAATTGTVDATYTESGAGMVGWAVAGLGDLDGDGFDDASFTSVVNNSVYLLFGSAARASGVVDPSTLPRVQDTDPVSGYTFRYGAAGVDLDADGLSDVAMISSAGGLNLNILYGDPGRPTIVDRATLPELEIPGPQSYSYSARPAGDLNQDGYPDLVVADPGHTSLGGYGAGEAWILPGGGVRYSGTGDLVAAATATIQGVDYGSNVGADARGIGDFFAGPGDDLAVSAPFWSVPYQSMGAVALFDGESLTGAVRFDEAPVLITGSAASQRTGTAIAAADVDGDGLQDLAIAAPDAAETKGQVSVILGGSL